MTYINRALASAGEALGRLGAGPIGRFIRDLAEGAVAGAVAAVIGLNLDMTTPRGVAFAALSGAIGGIIAVARRALVNLAQKPS